MVTHCKPPGPPRHRFGALPGQIREFPGVGRALFPLQRLLVQNPLEVTLFRFDHPFRQTGSYEELDAQALVQVIGGDRLGRRGIDGLGHATNVCHQSSANAVLLWTGVPFLGFVVGLGEERQRAELRNGHA